MKQLSSQARAYLDALRVVDSPDDAATARVLAGVLDRAASGELGPELPPASMPAAATGAGVSAKTIAIAAALAGALAGALAAVAAADDPPAVPITPALVGLGAIEAKPAAIPAAAPIVAPPAIAPAPAVASPVRTGRPAAKGERVRGPATRTADPIAEEVALLSEARAALGAGDARSAIAVLRRHARRFADGVLAREREVSWITALCVLGDAEGARRRADAFLRDHGDSPHAAKVRASCGGR